METTCDDEASVRSDSATGDGGDAVCGHGDGPAIVPRTAAVSADIEALSERIRRAMECPVCLLVAWELLCLCPNGHAVCGDCLTQIWHRDAARHSCPLCRAPLVPTPDAQVTAAKMTEVAANVMVSCAHRPHGCPELHALRDVTKHEAQCPHAPDVRCLVSVCQWMGVYDQLFEHVRHAHNDVAVDAAENRLVVNDLQKTVSRNRRQTHLVQSPHGLFWIVFTRVTRGRARAGVFVVDQPPSDRLASGGEQRDRTPSSLTYRVTTVSNASKTRSRAKRVGLSSSLTDDDRGVGGKAGGGGGVDDPYTIIRPSGGIVEIRWWSVTPSDRGTGAEPRESTAGHDR